MNITGVNRSAGCPSDGLLEVNGVLGRAVKPLGVQNTEPGKSPNAGVGASDGTEPARVVSPVTLAVPAGVTHQLGVTPDARVVSPCTPSELGSGVLSHDRLWKIDHGFRRSNQILLNFGCKGTDEVV